MIQDRQRIGEEHRRGADLIRKYLDQGKNVVCLVLGDSTIYCTFSYLQHILEEEGYPVELVSGVPSFCAAAARMNLPLTEWDEPLHIIPAVHRSEDLLDQPGTYVLMKAASHMKETKALIRQSGREACAVLDCGMESEKVCRSVDEIPDDAGYFSLIISREQKEENHE